MLHIRESIPLRTRRGFSLLEVTIALSISGFLFSAIWQLTATAGVQREAAALSSQALIVTSAAKDYISGQNTVLLALPQLSALGNVARVKITDDDTGDTANSIQSAGYLPQDFTNLNSYGQSYALFVKREDGGSPGVADNGDRVIGLLVTTGGTEISDQMGSRIASSMGAPGGFIYDEGNPANPAAATDAHGAAGGWKVDLTSVGWSSIGTVAQAGRIATLVNLVPSGMGVGGGGGGGASEIDDLSDGIADYTNGNVFLGQYSGNESITGQTNIGIGINVLPNATTTSSNTALGYNALSTVNIRSGSTAIGFEAMRYGYVGGTPQLSYNTAVGYQALRGINDPTWNYGVGNVAVGHSALLNGYVASSNVAIGAARLNQNGPLQVAGTGSFNVAIGSASDISPAALGANTSGSSNVAVGQAAGSNITTGSNNIMLGTATVAASATASNQLNIGNTIYGNLSTDQINIGSATIITGIGFDVGTNTSASRLSVGTTAQRPTCDATTTGAMRWNSSFNSFEWCRTGQWIQPITTSGDGTPPTPNPGTGYFVVTSGIYNGNLGGMAGADSICLSELTSNNWMFKTAAVANGQLIASKVKAFICNINGPCNGLIPLTTYYFANAGDPAAGGASFTSGPVSEAPCNNVSWAAYNYFNTTDGYWTGHWQNNYEGSCTIARGAFRVTAHGTSNACSNWTSGSAGNTAYRGNPAYTNEGRWSVLPPEDCNNTYRLICMVHP